jgi:hypothetical protein
MSFSRALLNDKQEYIILYSKQLRYRWVRARWDRLWAESNRLTTWYSADSFLQLTRNVKSFRKLNDWIDADSKTLRLLVEDVKYKINHTWHEGSILDHCNSSYYRFFRVPPYAFSTSHCILLDSQLAETCEMIHLTKDCPIEKVVPSGKQLQFFQPCQRSPVRRGFRMSALRYKQWLIWFLASLLDS